MRFQKPNPNANSACFIFLPGCKKSAKFFRNSSLRFSTSFFSFFLFFFFVSAHLKYKYSSSCGTSTSPKRETVSYSRIARATPKSAVFFLFFLFLFSFYLINCLITVISFCLFVCYANKTEKLIEVQNQKRCVVLSKYSRINYYTRFPLH